MSNSNIHPARKPNGQRTTFSLPYYFKDTAFRYGVDYQDIVDYIADEFFAGHIKNSNEAASFAMGYIVRLVHDRALKGDKHLQSDAFA